MSRIVDKVLSSPLIYETYQSLIGAPHCHSQFISQMVAPASGERILDVGCGVGASVRFLPQNIEYVGIDVSQSYIDVARGKFGAGRTFICADLSSVDPQRLGLFDRAFAFGLLHHLSDAKVRQTVDLVRRVVKPKGLFVTIDPCYFPGQSAIAKFLIDNDRGEHVRDRGGFERLVSDLGRVQSLIFNDLLQIPYTQIVMTVTVERRDDATSDSGRRTSTALEQS